MQLPAHQKAGRRQHTAPLLSALTVSMLCTSLVSALGAHGIFQKYNTDGWAQPAVAVLMQGLAHQKLPWDTTSSGTGSGSASMLAGRQSDVSESSVSFVGSGQTDSFGAGSPASDGSPSGQTGDSGTGSPASDSSPSGQTGCSSLDSSGLDSPASDGSPSGQAGDSGTGSPASGSSPSGQAGDSGTGSPASGNPSPEQQPPGSPVPENNQPEQAEASPPESTPYEFTQVTQEYFDDALLIGDSRAEGVKLYSGWDNLTYYAEGGMTVYNMFQSQTALDGEGRKISVEEALQNRSFGKIYLEIGINEMGTGTLDSFMEAYETVVNRLRELQPDAILYVCGIMYVKQSKSESDPIFNNPNIQARNDRISQLADGEHIFYLDINELVTDETGNLNPDYTWDEVHLLGKYDSLWLDYFCSHGIVRNTSDNS